MLRPVPTRVAYFSSLLVVGFGRWCEMGPLKCSIPSVDKVWERNACRNVLILTTNFKPEVLLKMCSGTIVPLTSATLFHEKDIVGSTLK
jgi:hypothetical protein